MKPGLPYIILVLVLACSESPASGPDTTGQAPKQTPDDLALPLGHWAEGVSGITLAAWLHLGKEVRFLTWDGKIWSWPSASVQQSAAFPAWGQAAAVASDHQAIVVLTDDFKGLQRWHLLSIDGVQLAEGAASGIRIVAPDFDDKFVLVRSAGKPNGLVTKVSTLDRQGVEKNMFSTPGAFRVERVVSQDDGLAFCGPCDTDSPNKLCVRRQARDGTVEWSKDFDTEIGFCSAAVATTIGSYAFVGATTVHAFDRNGKSLWKRTTSPSAEQLLRFESAAAATGNVLVLSTTKSGTFWLEEIGPAGQSVRSRKLSVANPDNHTIRLSFCEVSDHRILLAGETFVDNYIARLAILDRWGHDSPNLAGICSSKAATDCPGPKSACQVAECMSPAGCQVLDLPEGATCDVGKLCKAGKCS